MSRATSFVPLIDEGYTSSKAGLGFQVTKDDNGPPIGAEADNKSLVDRTIDGVEIYAASDKSLITPSKAIAIMGWSRFGFQAILRLLEGILQAHMRRVVMMSHMQRSEPQVVAIQWPLGSWAKRVVPASLLILGGRVYCRERVVG